MAEASAKALKAALEAIRERADYALKQLTEAVDAVEMQRLPIYEVFHSASPFRIRRKMPPLQKFFV